VGRPQGAPPWECKSMEEFVHYRIEKSGQFLEIAIVDWLSIFTTEKNEANFWV